MTPELTASHNEAKVALMRKADSAFFTTLCFSMKHEFDSSIPTACTNGLKIKFNPDFWMALNKEERVFLMLHEAMHVALMHMVRLGDRKPKRYNRAGDYVINGMLINRGFTMPRSGLHDRQYDGMSTDQVYDLLDDNDDDFDEDLQPCEGDMEVLREEIEDILVRSQIQSNIDKDRQGTIPGELEILINKLLKPTLPWDRILSRYLNAYVKNDYSFKKPNKRFFPKFILPSLHSKGLANIAIAVDASGSVSDNEFSRFTSEIGKILKTLKPEKITVLQFDWKINNIDEVTNLNGLSKIEFVGRGGTDIREVLEWNEKNKPTTLIVFTDGYFTNHETRNKNIIWVIHNNKSWEKPYGQKINYEIK